MDGRWSSAQVLALAPDPAAVKAGQGQATPRKWSGTGASAQPAAVWGRCQGSGKQPYQVTVDLAETAYRCSCPSRKHPCKHVLGLLLLWSEGGVPEAEAPAEFAAEWLLGRAERAAQAEAKRTAAPADSADDRQRAQQQRAEQREAKVAAGLAELDRWLADQVRTGLAGTERAGHAHFSQVAARMVDAQAKEVASELKRLPAVAASGEGWAGRLLAAYARLHLLVTAHQRLSTLPDALAETVRAHVGYPVPQKVVLEQPGLRDQWSVLARRDDIEESLRTRRTWLRGVQSGRDALVLAYSGPGEHFDDLLMAGVTLDAELHFYPGTAPLRALIGARHGVLERFVPPQAAELDAAPAGLAAARAADPWLTRWPALVCGVPVGTAAGWVLAGPDGALPLRQSPADEALWRLVAVAGGRPLALYGEWDGVSFELLAAVRENDVVML